MYKLIRNININYFFERFIEYINRKEYFSQDSLQSTKSYKVILFTWFYPRKVLYSIL